MAPSLSSKQAKTTSKASSAISESESYSVSEVRSGFLLAASGLLLFSMLIMSSKSLLFHDSYEIPVTFSYIGGLAKNAPVHLAGMQVGRVKEIRFKRNLERPVEVILSIDKSAPVKSDSQAYIDALGFMGEKYVELTAGTPSGEPLTPGTSLAGTDPVPMVELIKKGNEIADEFQKTAKNMQLLVTDLQGLVGQNKEDLTGIISNLNASSSNLKDMTHDLKLHPWKLLRKSNAVDPDAAEKKKRKFLIL